MYRLGNPWFLLVVGVIAMAAYGYYGSPIEMAVIGSPFFLCVVGVAMLVRYGKPARAPATPQPGPGNQRIFAATYMPLMVGGVAYLLWSRFTESGPIGWLDAIQARRDGTYDSKLSLVVGLVYLLFLVGVVVTLLTKFLPKGTPASATRASTPAKKTVNLRRQVMFTGIGIFIAIWAGGFGTYEYYTIRNQQEMHATYQPVDVAVPVGAAASLEFVALRGIQHPAGYISRRGEHSNDGTDFIPLVAPTTRDRDVPVHWVVEQKSAALLPARSQAIRAHALGETLSQPTREAFSRMGVHLADDVVLVSFVATSSNGVVADGSENYWLIFIVGTSVLSALTLLFFFIAWWRHPK